MEGSWETTGLRLQEHCKEHITEIWEIGMQYEHKSIFFRLISWLPFWKSCAVITYKATWFTVLNSFFVLDELYTKFTLI